MHKDIKDKINTLYDLPTFPAILKQLIEVLQDDRSSFVDIYNIIRYDQSLTERILKIANSPYFGHSGKVNGLEQAIMLIGFDLVKSICFGASVFPLVSNVHKKTIRGLWKHSFEVGIIAANIAENVGNVESALSFTSGLLHDIGRVLFLIIDQEKCLDILHTDDFLNEEIKVFGIDHGEVGSYFLEKALLPKEIVFSVRLHHRPSLFVHYDEAVYKELASIVALSEALSRSFFPKIQDDGIWTEEHDAILLEFSLDDHKMNVIREKAVEEIASMEDILNID